MSPNGFSSPRPVVLRMSTNGQYLVYSSDATDLIPGGTTNGFRNIFVRDLFAGTNMVVSVDSNGVADVNAYSTTPVISRTDVL